MGVMGICAKFIATGPQQCGQFAVIVSFATKKTMTIWKQGMMMTSDVKQGMMMTSDVLSFHIPSTLCAVSCAQMLAPSTNDLEPTAQASRKVLNHQFPAFSS